LKWPGAGRTSGGSAETTCPQQRNSATGLKSIPSAVSWAPCSTDMTGTDLRSYWGMGPR